MLNRRQMDSENGLYITILEKKIKKTCKTDQVIYDKYYIFKNLFHRPSPCYLHGDVLKT